MILAYLLLLTGLTISAVAIYYSVIGLTAIFSAAAIPIIIMGSALEVGKLVCASWLKSNWDRAPGFMKYYMTTAVVVLMLITSMGIFGFLSKAHNDQNLVSGDVQSKLAIYDEKIKTAKENIEVDRKQIKQMDDAVDQIMGRSTDEKGADKANAVRKSQQKDRQALARDIEANQKTISQLNDEAAPIRAENRKVEAEVGPIKYIAAFVYGANPDANILERAVTWVIILIVIVFDPLAVVMLLASQMTFGWIREEREKEKKGLLYDNDGTIIGVAPTIAELDRDVGEPPTTEELFEDDFDEPEFEEEFVAEEEHTPVEVNKHTQPDTVTVSEGEPPSEPEPIQCYKCGTELVNAPGIGLFCPNKTCDVKDGPLLEELETTHDVQFIEEHSGEEETIVVDDSSDLERPGDYVTPLSYSEPTPTGVSEAAPGRNRGIMHVHLVPSADNVPALGKASNAGFGIEFPATPEKGDVYLRVDYLPNRLFKFNGDKWIQVDKDQTDVYAYNELYIRHLIDQIGQGKYDTDSLTDIEREQIQQYLTKNAQ